MNVPVENVYRLLLYAWNLVGEGEEALLSAGNLVELHDLFAHVLAGEVGKLAARGVERGYVAREEELAGVRGRIDLGETVKRTLHLQARTACRFEELTHDTPANRILRATLGLLLALPLAPAVADGVARARRHLAGVPDAAVTREDFRRVQLHRGNRGYRFALRLCRLIHRRVMVNEGTGRAHFRAFEAKPQSMGALFEAFLVAFLRRERPELRVERGGLPWHALECSDADRRRFPRMRTDAVVTSAERCIVLDTKCYARPLLGRRGIAKVRSEHLYQILTYVHHLAARTGDRPPHEAMLLYPVVDEPFDLRYRLDGRPIRVRSVNLGQPWPAVHAEILSIFAAA